MTMKGKQGNGYLSWKNERREKEGKNDCNNVFLYSCLPVPRKLTKCPIPIVRTIHEEKKRDFQDETNIRTREKPVPQRNPKSCLRCSLLFFDGCGQGGE